MKKSTDKSIRKTAVLSRNKFMQSRHPMTKIEKEAPRKSKVNRQRKGTAC